MQHLGTRHGIQANGHYSFFCQIIIIKRNSILILNLTCTIIISLSFLILITVKTMQSPTQHTHSHIYPICHNHHITTDCSLYYSPSKNTPSTTQHTHRHFPHAYTNSNTLHGTIYITCMRLIRYIF